MRKVVVPLFLALGAIGLVAPASATPPGFPEFIPFDPGQGEFPEGVAVDKTGNVFVGFDVPRGEIRKYTPDGQESLLVDFGAPGVLGLAVDAPGNVYAAREVFPNNGVYRVDKQGNAERLPGTEAIVFPNSLAFDKRGNLYVTESFSFDPPLAEFPGCDIGFGPFFGQGGIWRIPPGGQAELWLRHELLTGLCLPIPIPFPVGANGIAYRQDSLFVTNSERSIVVRVPINTDGSPGTPQVLADVGGSIPPTPFGTPAVDGIALDVHGGMYVLAIDGSTLVRISPDGGTFETLATAADGLDFPASLAFGTGKRERRSVFLTNFAIGPPGGAGPGLVKLAVGVPGLPVP